MPQATGALTKVIGYTQPSKGTIASPPVAEVIYVRTLDLDDQQPLEQDPTLAGGFRGELKGARSRVDASGTLVTTLGTSIGWLLKHLFGAPTTTGAGPYAHTFAVGVNPIPACFGIERDYSSRIDAPGRYVRTPDLRIASAAFAFSTASPFQQVTWNLRGMSLAALPAVGFLGAVAGVPTAGGGNVGNGTVTGVTLNPAAIVETWTLTCTAAVADGGTFSVVGSVSGAQADATVGQAYENDFLSFIINDGTTDFAVDDVFTIAVAAAGSPANDGGHSGFELAGMSLLLDAGATEVCVETLNFTIDNDLDTDLYCLNDGGQRHDLPEGNFICSGDGVAQFDTPALMIKAMNDESLALQIVMTRGTGAGTSGNEKLTINIPLSVITATKPAITGPRGIKQNFSFRAFRNTGAEVGVNAVLQNPRADYNT